jgi:hypothetical protein
MATMENGAPSAIATTAGGCRYCISELTVMAFQFTTARLQHAAMTCCRYKKNATLWCSAVAWCSGGSNKTVLQHRASGQTERQDLPECAEHTRNTTKHFYANMLDKLNSVHEVLCSNPGRGTCHSDIRHTSIVNKDVH